MNSFWKKKKVYSFFIDEEFQINEIILQYIESRNFYKLDLKRANYIIKRENNNYVKKLIDNIEYDKLKKERILKPFHNTHFYIELNYNDFINEVKIDDFLEYLEKNFDVFKKSGLIDNIDNYFFKLKIDGQANYFFTSIIDTIDFHREKLLRMLEEDSQNKLNIIQKHLIDFFIENYIACKDYILNVYGSIYLELKNSNKVIHVENNNNIKNFNNHLDKINTNKTIQEKPSLPRKEILKKLFDGTKNIEKFEKFEKILVKENYLNSDLEWIRNASDFIRFYNYLEEKKIIRNTFVNCNGVRYLGDLFSYAGFKTLESKSKRKKQNTKNHQRQFHKILD